MTDRSRNGDRKSAVSTRRPGDEKASGQQSPTSSKEENVPSANAGDSAQKQGAFSRRLSDKIRAAITQAMAQGRREIAEHLLLILQSIQEEGTLHQGRRSSDEPRH